MDHLVLEVGVALILIAAAGLLSTKVHYPIVPFLIIVGMAVGPHAPVIGPIDLRFFESASILEFMGRAGVLFLLFYLGLEFSVGRLIRAGRSIAIGGTIYIAINFTLGVLYAWSHGWPLREVLVSAGITTISSSAIVAKMLVELRRTANPETGMILGITMFEDVFLAVYLSIISGLVLSGATSLGGVLTAAAVSLGYMLAFLLLGRKLVPWLNRALDIASDEVFLLVVSAALLFIAGFSETIHVAESIGALLVGLVLAETAHAKRIERLVIPFRDLFGAIFFFSFGLSTDPFSLGGAVGIAVGAAVLTLVGNLTAGFIAGRTAGLSLKASTNIGLSILGRGEFSIIVANLGKAGGLLPVLQPFAALYVLILAILGPLLTKESARVFNLLNRIFRFERPRGESLKA